MSPFEEPREQKPRLDQEAEAIWGSDMNFGFDPDDDDVRSASSDHSVRSVGGLRRTRSSKISGSPLFAQEGEREAWVPPRELEEAQFRARW